jgi:hypothetical protein
MPDFTTSCRYSVKTLIYQKPACGINIAILDYFFSLTRCDKIIRNYELLKPG